MDSLWDDREAARYEGELGMRVYTSRLLGRDKRLVMHGGGNTSVKITETNILGEAEELLYVKGSGWDLETIEAPGFAPVRLAHLIRLAQLEELSDPQMVNELKTHMTRASAPTPSVEAILHAILPYRYVDHTHADAVIAVTNTADGRARIEEVYGDAVVVIPYIMPGFDLARLCAQRFAADAHEGTLGMVLMNHGIFSFGGTARESYERMISLVEMAEQYLESAGSQRISLPPAQAPAASRRLGLSDLRAELSGLVGAPVIMASHTDAGPLGFARHPQVATLSQQGPATPDHVIRTKRVPLVGRDTGAYARAYKEYFDAHAPGAKQPKTMLDPAPRVILDPELGMCCVGRNAKAAAVVSDIYRHTIDIILQAEALGGYRALPAGDIFDVEYWDLEQAKLKQGGKPPPLTGEVVMITGAASGIGRACVERFLAEGAAVVGLDIRAEIAALHEGRPDFLGLACDVTDEAAVDEALERAVGAFGGLDMLVLNAGMFPPGRRIEELDGGEWRTGHAPECGRQPGPHAPGPPPAQARAQRRPGGGHGLQERPGAGDRGGGLLRLQGGAESAGPGRRPGVGGGRHPGQHPAPQRGVRHRHLDRGGAEGPGRPLRPERRGVQDQQPAQDRGDQRRRGGPGGGHVRAPVRQVHRRADPHRRGQRAGDLSYVGRLTGWRGPFGDRFSRLDCFTLAKPRRTPRNNTRVAFLAPFAAWRELYKVFHEYCRSPRPLYGTISYGVAQAWE